VTKKRIRRTTAEIFIDKLTELSDGEVIPIGNGALRNLLGWDEGKYNRIKEQLINENLIEVGKGKGGSVKLAFRQNSEALTLFISYCHADEKFKDALIKHLEPLKRMNLIEAWHDRELTAGDEWEQEISGNLENADIILLLVSIDFINSEYCYDIELERALERHADGDAVVIPVILRTCMWHTTPFAKLQALPRDAKAVASWPDIDEALANVAEGIKVVAEKLRSEE
jgi:hypothetical protein